MLSEKTSKSSKSTKIISVIVGVFLMIIINDSFITHNYLSNSPISSNWLSIERYLLAILSATLFVRGVYGFKKDKDNSKILGKIYFGYHWDSKNAVQLMTDIKEYVSGVSNESDNFFSKHIRTRFIEYIVMIIIILSGVAAFEIITGFYLNGGRTKINPDILQFNGVTAWGDSQAIFAMIALLELIIQLAFLSVFVRGIIGFYHDYLVSKNINEFIVFEDVKAPYLDKLERAIKLKLKK